jgi:hypothetical protein
MANARNGFYVRRKLGRLRLRTAAEQQHIWDCEDRSARKAERAEREGAQHARFEATVADILHTAFWFGAASDALSAGEACRSMWAAIDYRLSSAHRAAQDRVPVYGYTVGEQLRWLRHHGFWAGS